MADKRISISGFSMIELMVVVAILAVLAGISIPQYRKFQARAKQSEAKLSLASLYVSEQTFKNEWASFTVDLNNAGYAVVGSKLRYVVGFNSGAGCTSYPPTATGAPEEFSTVNDTWTDGTNVNSGSAVWAAGSITKPTIVTTVCTNTSFVATAYGHPGTDPIDPGPTNGDTWLINQLQLITHFQSRID